jgi:hypothetical protein
MKTCPHCGGSLEGETQQALSLSGASELPVIATLPLLNGKTYAVYQSMVDTWQRAYPGVNITQEIRKMAAWLDSNPKNKKTTSGILRFANSWLSRTQNGSGGNGNKPYGYQAEREQITRTFGRRGQ